MFLHEIFKHAHGCKKSSTGQENSQNLLVQHIIGYGKNRKRTLQISKLPLFVHNIK